VVKSAAVLAVAEPVFDAGAPPEPGFQSDDVRAVVSGMLVMMNEQAQACSA